MGGCSRSWRPEVDEEGQLCDMDVAGWIRAEFRSAEFGDKRLTDRLVQPSIADEEWHKVLKTGCKIDKRQLQTWERMEVLLSVYSVIAWKVLELRELAVGGYQVRKLSPQPHSLTTFGFSTWKPAPCSPPSYSSAEPSM